MDNILPDLKASEPVQEDLSSLEKLTGSYLLLKKKICGTHELIKQYNDKLKECERLKTDLDAATKQTKKVTCNYNCTLAKVIKLELQNTEYKKNIESLTTQVNEHKIKTAADQQHIQQLICKIKEIEGNQNDRIMQYDLEKSSLQVKVKELEQELKNVKKSYDTKMKKIEKKLPTENDNKAKLRDIGINTILTKDVIVQKPEVTEKCIITDVLYDVKNDVYPVFCAKCEDLIEPPPFEKICTIMTNSCPKLIEKISSPKKVSSPLQVPIEIGSEHCKTENLITLPDTPPPHLENQNNHTDFIPAHLLPPHAAITLNRADYCNNFSPTSNLMNQSTYYIGSTPINPLSLTNSGTINQNNHSENMVAMASSLSIISSLQKRIDTLEVKIKKKLNKRKSDHTNSCWEHNHPNTCCMSDMKNSMQFSFMELWKRMIDFYDNKKKKRFDTHKSSDKKLSNYKLSRLKCRKRLQNAHSGSWKVESLTNKLELNSSRKRSKKRKYRYSSLFNKSDASLNNVEDLNKSNSDSDINSCINDSFHDFDNSKTNINVKSKNSSPIEMSNSNLKSDNTIKTSTCSTQSTDTDEAEIVETIQNSVESSKSVGGETDSGILSDSIESGKMMQLEADVDTCLDSTECENTKKIKSSIQNESCLTKNNKLLQSKIPARSIIKASHLIKSNKLIETDTASGILSQSDEHIENLENTKVIEVSEHDGVMPQIKACTSNITDFTRKRKINEPQELKKHGSRQDLLKKLKNLRENTKVVNNAYQNVSHYQNIQSSERENPNMSQEQKNSICDKSIIKVEEYIPKKRPRIAHVPKSPLTDQRNLLNGSLQLKKCLTKDIGNSKIEPLTNIPTNNENNSNTAMEQTKMQKNDLNELKEENNELQKRNNNKAEALKPTFLNIGNSNVENCIKNNPSDVTIPDIKNSLNELENKNSSNIGMNNHDCSNIFVECNINDSVTEMLETKTELNNKHEYSEYAHKNDSIPTMKIKNENSNLDRTQKNVSLQEDFNVYQNFTKESYKLDLRHTHNEGSHSVNVSVPKNDFDMCNKKHGIEKAVQNTQPYDLNNLSLNSKDMHLINMKKSDIKETNLNAEQTFNNSYAKETNSSTQSQLSSPCSLAKLKQYINKNKYLNKNCKIQHKKLMHIHFIADKFVKKQLQILMDSDWQTSVHWDVIEKLKATCSPRIIAKGIVDFLGTEQDCNTTLDNSHTPPAPLMTKAQQRITALLIDLEESKPTVFQFVQAGIEYKLFRLNQSIERSTIESLARIYTVLARIKKDREKVRIFCCDALYCLGLNAILILYTVFTCWPEVFPNNETNNKLLPKCMAHLIMTQQATDFPKLYALKNLISVFYKYQVGTLSKDLLAELLTALQEKSHGEIETAIVLLAKREGTTWTYKNIVRNALLPMIINNKLPSTYRAFCLLGNLMRAFPVEDKDNSVGEIVEQLCDLINSGEGSDEQKEGIISALLSLSRHKFDEVVQNILKWSPTAPLHDRTEKQFNGLFNLRNADFWKNYLKKNKHLQEMHKKSKT